VLWHVVTVTHLEMSCLSMPCRLHHTGALRILSKGRNEGKRGRRESEVRRGKGGQEREVNGKNGGRVSEVEGREATQICTDGQEIYAE
jgi:hypothetical protein